MADFDASQSRLRLKVKNEGAITISYPADGLTATDENVNKETIGGLLLTGCILLHHCGPKAEEAITMRVISFRYDDEIIIKVFCPNCGLRLPDGDHVKLRTIRDMLTWCEWSGAPH